MSFSRLWSYILIPSSQDIDVQKDGVPIVVGDSAKQGKDREYSDKDLSSNGLHSLNQKDLL